LTRKAAGGRCRLSGLLYATATASSRTKPLTRAEAAARTSDARSEAEVCSGKMLMKLDMDGAPSMGLDQVFTSVESILASISY
jgi:hypothetical protein